MPSPPLPPNFPQQTLTSKRLYTYRSSVIQGVILFLAWKDTKQREMPLCADFGNQGLWYFHSHQKLGPGLISTQFPAGVQTPAWV